MSVTAIHAFTGPLFGDGATVAFPFDFMVGSTDEVGVMVEGVEQSTSAYSVTLNSNGTGTITFVDPPANGEEVLPFSNPIFTQTTTFGSAGAFLPTTHDRVNDAAARRDIFLRERMLASLRAPRGEVLAELPSAADRAGRFLAFDAEGDPVDATGLGSDTDLRTDLAANDGSLLMGFLQSGTGATARTALSKMRDLLSIKDFGANGDGATDNAVPFGVADAAADILVIPPGTFVIDTDTTVNADLVFLGGVISVAAGNTLTLRGQVIAGMETIFTGSGSVVGIRDVRPEWFGAVRDGTTDDLAALNKAHTCVQGSKLSRGDRARIRLAGGTYGVTSTWVVAPCADVSLAIEGAGTGLGGTRITDLTAFNSAVVPVVQIDSSTDAIQQIADWSLTGMAVVKGTGLATIGLQIGSTSSTKMLIGENWSSVEGVNVWGFANNAKLCHVRQVLFSRFSSWNNGYVGACVPLLITVNGGVTCDLIFDDSCQFVSNDTTAGSRCVKILCSSGDFNNATGANSIAGVKFGNGDFYAGEVSVEITCSNGGYINDIWFSGAQFDQATQNKILITATKDSATAPTIQNININSCFFVGSLSTEVKLVSGGTGGIIREVDVSNNYSKGSQGPLLTVGGVAGGVKSLVCNDNRVTNNNYHTGVGAVIDLDQVDRAQCVGNILSQPDGASFATYMVNIALGALNYVVRLNNAGGAVATGVVNDNGGAVTKSVGDNV